MRDSFRAAGCQRGREHVQGLPREALNLYAIILYPGTRGMRQQAFGALWPFTAGGLCRPITMLCC